MIKNWYFTGDCHHIMKKFKGQGFTDEDAIIILGDAGCNYFFDERDAQTKNCLEKYGGHYYLVRGNHEARPEDMDMPMTYDKNVSGPVFYEPDFPHIHYFIDGKDYIIDGHTTLVIGGAYSVDKYYRLATGRTWFEKEQLTTEEMNFIEYTNINRSFDFVLSHTCPYSWRPTDLFLPMVDQSTVDNSMELWMEDFKDKINWKVWCFGHFHQDRVERPNVEMFFNDIEKVESIWDRWTSGKELDWWITKSPNYYMGV